ncbi:toxin-antitoxin system YwqK family antitoxin [Tenacibaculum piscium]|uniref:Antitoxin component YwqK of the YwqJK toxin-antitoxin module n=1 Tax=Tenacibaculum piscium TaxID=1458515 RepID=A0A2H1YIQ7_9FLAO|nr:hypothetical protein [Tenacibaculum piscium]MBE7628563.1 hypothetical protein [Tenacibaculum piscium]MBE7669704.1 hypothetical protein [Tenacibaculum piscium]SOS75353.1 conserved hypothetical protein [Tenacibaculum piscium]
MNKVFNFLLLFFISQNAIFSQKTMLWRDVDIQKFGKETIYKNLKGETLDGDFKIAERNGAYSKVTFTNGLISKSKLNYDSDGVLYSEINYKNSLKDGDFTIYYTDKSIKRKGTYIVGNKNGKWTTYNKKGEEIGVENYKDDVKNGVFWERSTSRMNPEKNLVSQKEYKNGLPKGTWFAKNNDNLIWEKKYSTPENYVLKNFHKNGTIKNRKEYKNNQYFGNWFEKNEEGDLKWEKKYTSNNDYTEKRYHENNTIKYQKNYKNGRIDGDYIRYNKEGEKTIVEFYKDNKKHGKWFRKYSDGNIVLEEYNTGKPSGNWYKKDKNGSVFFEKSYVNSEKYNYKKYYINENIKESGTYNKGKLDGNYLKYNLNKVLLVKQFYENGKLINSALYFENGNKKQIIKQIGKTNNATVEIYSKDGFLIKKGRYLKRYKNGLWQFFEPKKGRLVEEITYANNAKHGLYKKYNAANIISIEGNYVNNNKDSVWKHYNLDGSINKEIEYKLGKKIATKTFN